MAKQLQLSYNGIQYTKVYQPAIIIGGKIGFDNYIIDENYNITNINDPETYGKIVNAIDIDWNGANLSSAASSFANAADTVPVSTITTTGELMKGVYSPMFAKTA